MSTSTAAALRYPGVHAAANADKPAVVMAHDGATQTYVELDAMANRFAHALRRLGVGAGGHVALVLENRLEYPALVWGAHYAGTYYTPMSTRLAPGEAAYIVEDTGAKVVVVSAASRPDVLRAIAAAAPAPVIVDVDASGLGVALGELLDPEPDRLLDGAVEGSDMMYSSGTTGRPKGIKPALTGLPVGSTMLAADLAALVAGLDESSVYLSPAPLYHTAPCKWVQATTAVGGTAVIMRQFDEELALRTIQDRAVTVSQWVPTMFRRMLRLPDDVRSRYDVSSMRVAVHSAAPCPPGVKRAMIDWWGPILTEYYAGTEAVGMTLCTSREWLERPGTVGRAVFGEIHIVDAHGEEVPVGSEGLISFRAGRPLEYHNDIEKTRSAHVRAGQATMGDVGRLDADGYLFLTDRQSNMIISGGVNVYPQETENVLQMHPAVADAAVIGVPNEDFGEEVRAVVQVGPGYRPGEELAAELIAYTRERLADLKCPRQVDFRAELPREPTGKLMKRLLRDEYWAGRESRLA